MSDAQPQLEAGACDPAEWVDRHGDALYRYALLRTRDSEQAEDAVQECLVSALGSHRSFAGRSSERTWLIGILRRKLIDRVRKKMREQSIRGTDSLLATEQVENATFDKAGKWKVSPGGWSGEPHTNMDRREFWEAFHACLKALPTALAGVFMLRELDQLESEEICEVLGLTPTNLWTRLHRARLGLRSCLEKGWFGKPDSATRGGES